MNKKIKYFYMFRMIIINKIMSKIKKSIFPFRNSNFFRNLSFPYSSRMRELNIKSKLIFFENNKL